VSVEALGHDTLTHILEVGSIPTGPELQDIAVVLLQIIALEIHAGSTTYGDHKLMAAFVLLQALGESSAQIFPAEKRRG